jgi:hypothetical protein
LPSVERLFDLYTMVGPDRDPELSPMNYAKLCGEARQLEDRIGATPRARLTLAAAISAARGDGPEAAPRVAGLDDLVAEANRDA